MPRTLIVMLSLVASLLLHVQAFAAIEVYEFDDESLRQRYLMFIDEMRCPKCQNQNLAGSDSPIAEDLRRELRRLISEGRSDDEIVDFMVSRYGDYVLYRPRLQSNTLVLWLLPAGLLLLGLLVALFIVFKRRGADSLDATDGADEQKLARLLKEADDRLEDASRTGDK